MTDRDERNPIDDTRDLPVPEVGDLGSFEREPAGGNPDAAEPELEIDVQVDDVDLQSATVDPTEVNE